MFTNKPLNMTEYNSKKITTFVNLLIQVAVTPHVSHPSINTIFLQKTSSPCVLFKKPILLELLCVYPHRSHVLNMGTLTPQVRPYYVIVTGPHLKTEVFNLFFEIVRFFNKWMKYMWWVSDKQSVRIQNMENIANACICPTPKKHAYINWLHLDSKCRQLHSI